MKTIRFEAISKKTNFNENKPSPSVKSIPDWFRKMPRFPQGKTHTRGNGQISQTIKACSPFLDSFSMGYVIKLEFDVLVKKQNGIHFFEWREGDQVISTHEKQQLVPQQIPAGYSAEPYKFENKYSVRTPAGYSTLFVHPLNRTDLPFVTLSGVVETDSYELPTNFPFLIKEDFEGVLEAGTPIAQCIPIKRENWSHEISQADPEKIDKAFVKLQHKLLSSYKSQWWIRKEYK